MPQTPSEIQIPTATLPVAGARILVIGGRGGIGRVFVDACREVGCEIAIFDLRESLKEYPVADGMAAFEVDVTVAEQVADAFSALAADWQAIDGLVFLSGYSNPPTPIAELDLLTWDEIITTNLRSAFLCSQHAIPLLVRGRDPSMLMMASGLGKGVEKGTGAYSASKAGLIALTKVLAKELAPDVRVNALAPGPVETAFLSGGTGRGGTAGDRGWFTERMQAAGIDVLGTIPLGRLALPEDVVGPMLFMISPAARYFTGQVLYVNGGRLMP